MPDLTEPSYILKNFPTRNTATDPFDHYLHVTWIKFIDHVLNSDYQRSAWACTDTARHSCKTWWRPASRVLSGTTRRRPGSCGQTAWV